MAVSWGERWRRAGLALAVVVLLLAGLAVANSGTGRAAPNDFVTLADGTQIAVNVRLPDGYQEGERYPTVFEMSGYDGGSAEDGTLTADLARATGLRDLPSQGDSRQLTRMFNERYVTVHASIRGTGCSSGEFDLFSWRSALDGREVIDGYIARQPWSNGEVAIMGHSYSGITGFMVAATQPDHLRAVTVSGLVDDLYRALVHPGGVSNYGFPVLWTGAIRPGNELAGGVLPGLVRPEEADDTADRRTRCLANLAGKRRTVVDDPLLRGLPETDGDWYRQRSLITYADRVKVPIHVTGTWQDEQTGPRGFTHLWEEVSGVPKRLLVSNGNHATNQSPEVMADRKSWIDHWMLDVDGGHGRLPDQRSTVTTLLETAGGVPNGRLESRTFPPERAAWTEWYLRTGGLLSTDAPSGAERADQYLAGTLRQSWSVQAGPTAGAPLTTADGPDQVVYRTEPFAGDVAVVGPAVATLFARTTAPDTDFFVQLVDRAPDGSRSYLQRGLLKASHRALDPARSDRLPDGRVYRPFHPHVDPEPVVPGRVYEYVVEVFPVGHVVRAGHQLEVVVSAPPAVDGYYVYVPQRLPGLTAVLHDAAHPSRLLLATVPVAGAGLGAAPGCGQLDAVRCVPAP